MASAASHGRGTARNVLQRLCGIAPLRTFVDIAAAETRARHRKTTPICVPSRNTRSARGG